MSKRIDGLKATPGKMEVYFKDGGRLLEFSVYESNGAPCLDKVTLYRDGKIAASVTDKPGRRKFRSDGTVSKRELAEYWDSALGLAESRFRRYERGKIKDGTWMKPEYLLFWMIANEGYETRLDLEGSQDELPLERILEKDYRLEFSRFEADAPDMRTFDGRSKHWP